jgi:glycosyltransferase involved in cell wall biosynthesis
VKILHITESYGGGVTSAINTYVNNSSQYDHYLFALSRESDTTGEEGEGAFVDVRFASRNLSVIRSLKLFLNETCPAVVHVHSSFAGFFCRVLPFIDKRKIVYTPHGFSFLRNDHPLLLRFYFFIEKLLANRVACIAGCGREEKMLASSLVDPIRTHELVNICGEIPSVDAVKSQSELPVVGMVGRVSEQKGYEFFKSVAIQCKGKAHFKWVGGGSDENEELLRSSGIEVTGWVERSEVISHLKGLDLYFHSAAWEGFPISVLEASKLEVPMVLRDIGAFTHEGLFVVSTIEEAVSEICAWADRDCDVRAKASGIPRKISEWHTQENLQKSLVSLYEKFAV